MTLARKIVRDLREREGGNLLAAGVTGSVAYGNEKRHSDLDMVIIVRRERPLPKYRVREGILVSTDMWTPAKARENLTGANPNLPEVLAGWRSIRPLYDPSLVLRHLKARAFRVPASQWRRCARACLLGTYEDLGKLRDAAEARDRAKLREMAIWFTGGAAAALVCLKRQAVPAGKEMFVEVRRMGAIGRDVARLRYGNLGISAASRLAESIWAGLLREARRQGVRVADLP